jgi:hypothetical protein
MVSGGLFRPLLSSQQASLQPGPISLMKHQGIVHVSSPKGLPYLLEMLCLLHLLRQTARDDSRSPTHR